MGCRLKLVCRRKRKWKAEKTAGGPSIATNGRASRPGSWLVRRFAIFENERPDCSALNITLWMRQSNEYECDGDELFKQRLLGNSSYLCSVVKVEL